ncbi:Bug family tripartite tricarboxylate transporter substrate binding protein [Azohydromonas caseinilytica]|uniref:Tripartite tricarboxylate transporter substrate binding protein n=1 Tax=Azohydromonas caseinilytica TaxID=2728836 RepID=A0A848FDC0_9BURK|nr:tripartite tricarboxylate transporter substrate-binding protein [Azohydromonas caseinilytica]NML16389.1 tripartite tricarboxylate transporter substrate binding protein [Azohydromonas caseinilytica]
MRRRHLLLGLSALALPPLGALAQSPLKLVVGFPPGTGPDVLARTLGQKLGELMKQNLVIDNRAGAGGQIATQAVAKSAPDGTTVLLGEVGSIAIAPAAYSKLPYDPARELIPVAEVVRSDFILVVPASSPVKDLKGFIDAARAHRDRLNFATFGAGTPGHFGAEVLAEQAGFRIEPVHYRATGDAITALVSGDVQAAFVSTALAVPQVKGGKLRALATTAAARSSLLPEVPTFAEAGWPKVDFSAWFALFVPAGTPAAAIEQLGRQAVAAVQAPDVKQKLQEAGFTVTGVPRAETERMVKAEAQRWAGIVKASGFKAD